MAEREEIALGLAARESVAAIAAGLGRARSTVWRECRRNVSSSPRRYRAFQAEMMARARRSRPGKLAVGTPLRAAVVALARLDYSPQQIAATLRRQFPDRPEMQVSHETIYRALFVQGKGGLRAEIGQALRAPRRRQRRVQGRLDGRGRIPNMVHISARPAEAADRAVPGHWEGDLIIGARSASAVATLAERASRFCLIIALPDGYRAEQVSAALAAHITTLPTQLRRSLTWDQGKEMTNHAQFTIDTGVQVYFCDPHSPWQRGTNENTNGLIRYYLPKGSDLNVHTQTQLDTIAHKLNTRPRQTLGWRTPAETLADLLSATTT